MGGWGVPNTPDYVLQTSPYYQLNCKLKLSRLRALQALHFFNPIIMSIEMEEKCCAMLYILILLTFIDLV